MRRSRCPAEYEERMAKTIGSNEWAIGPRKTKSKKAMLFINPHQPWYGYGQFYEAHVDSGEGLHFSGSCFFGSPGPDDGPQRAFWAGRTRSTSPTSPTSIARPSTIAQHPLNYRYGDGYRTAVEWKDTILVANAAAKPVEHHYTFRKTHHGPIVGKEDATHA